MRRALFMAVVLALGCKKAEKRPVRTEPWPAPAAVSVKSGPKSSGVVRYALAQGSARVELRNKRTRVEGVLSRIEGQVELDPLNVEKTRAELRADLLSLDFEDPSLDAYALRALELDAEVPSEDRERERWAKLRIVGFENREPSDGTRRRSRKTRLSAFAELTLHSFRVPTPIELEVELDPAPGGSLQVRTRRPIVVDLDAHDLAPSHREDPGRARRFERIDGLEGFREARVSAELSFRPGDFAAITPNKP